MHVCADERSVLMLGVSRSRQQSTRTASRFRGGFGSLTLFSLESMRVLGLLWSRSPTVVGPDKIALRGATAFQFVERSHHLVTGDKWGKVTTWAPWASEIGF